MAKPHCKRSSSTDGLRDGAAGVSRQSMRRPFWHCNGRVCWLPTRARSSVFDFGALVRLQRMPLHDCQVRQLEREIEGDSRDVGGPFKVFGECVERVKKIL